MARVIVLDANVLIAYLDADDTHHHRTVELLEAHAPEGFATSVLTVAEALVHPTRVGRQDAALAAVIRVGVRVIPVTESDALSLARIRSQYRVRMPDAVALHAAISTRSGLATFDDSLASAAKQAGVAVAI